MVWASIIGVDLAKNVFEVHGAAPPTGVAPPGRLAAVVEGEEGQLPAAVAALAHVLPEQIAALGTQVDALETQLRHRAATDETVRRLMTIPGVGAISATALTTFAPPPETLAKGRDFAASVGLTPRRHSSGGKERLGRTSKMGRRDIRCLLIIGAVATVR